MEDEEVTATAGDLLQNESTNQSSSVEKYLFSIRSSTWFITLVVATIVWTDNFLYGIIIPVTPTILQSRLNYKDEDIQYCSSLLLAVYGAAVLFGSPLFGYVADRTATRRSTLLIGFVLLTCSIVMFHLANTIILLVVSRALQGLSAAVVFSAGLALLSDNVPQESSGRAMGFVNMSLKIAIISGPALGGVIYETSGNLALFSVAYAIIALDVILRSIVIEKRNVDIRVDQKHRSSSPRSKRGTLSTDSNATGGVEAESDGASAATLPVMVSPTMQLLSSDRFWAALFGWFMIGVILTAFDSTLPIFVHSMFGWGTSGAGLIMIPILLPELLAPLVGWLIDRHPTAPRFLAGGGFLLSVPIFTSLRFVDHDSRSQHVLLFVLLLLIGCCLTLCGPTLMSEVSRIVPYIESKSSQGFGPRGATGLAYGFFNCSIATGQLVGPLLFGWIKEVFGWPVFGWTLGLGSGVTGVLMALFLGGWITSFATEVDHESNEQEVLLSNSDRTNA